MRFACPRFYGDATQCGTLSLLGLEWIMLSARIGLDFVTMTIFSVRLYQHLYAGRDSPLVNITNPGPG